MVCYRHVGPTVLLDMSFGEPKHGAQAAFDIIDAAVTS